MPFASCFLQISHQLILSTFHRSLINPLRYFVKKKKSSKIFNGPRGLPQIHQPNPFVCMARSGPNRSIVKTYLWSCKINFRSNCPKGKKREKGIPELPAVCIPERISYIQRSMIIQNIYSSQVSYPIKVKSLNGLHRVSSFPDSELSKATRFV